GIRARNVTGVQTCALPTSGPGPPVRPLTRASAVLRGRTGGPGPARGNPERLLVERDRLDRQIVLSGEVDPAGGGLGGEGAFECRSEERRVGKEGRCGAGDG